MRPSRGSLGKAVFDAVRERLGFKMGLMALISAQVVNLMTLTAEIGGVAICLQLLSGLSYRWLILTAGVVFAIVVWVTPFEWVERIFGYGGLSMLVFAVAAVKLPFGGRATVSSRTSRHRARCFTPTSQSACSARR